MIVIEKNDTNISLKLKYLGNDIYGRPVYKDAESDSLFVDVNPHENNPLIFTKHGNMFDGKADKLVSGKVKIEFDGKRELRILKSKRCFYV